MTLVVAKKIKERLIIVSDTLLSNAMIGEKDEEPVHRYTKNDSTIKTVILESNLCISFAGIVKYAEKALKEIEGSKKTKAVVLNILDKSCKDSKGETDFIIYFGAPDYELYIIEDGERPLEVEKCYIGDQKGYIEYTKNMMLKEEEGHENILGSEFTMVRIPDSFTDEEREIYTKMRHSMLKVIQSSIKGVGGFIVVVVNEENGLKYMPYFTSNKSIQDFMIIPKIENGKLEYDIGKVEDGDHAENFICNNNNFFAVHWPLINIGHIYQREDYGLFIPTMFGDCDEIDFFDYLEKEKGVIRENYLLLKHTEQHFALKGNLFLKKKEYITALKYYDRALDRLTILKMNKETRKIYKKAKDILDIAINMTNKIDYLNNNFGDFNRNLEKLLYCAKEYLGNIEKIKDIKTLLYIKESIKNIFLMKGISYYEFATTNSHEIKNKEGNTYYQNLWLACLHFFIVQQIDEKFEKSQAWFGSTIALLTL